MTQGKKYARESFKCSTSAQRCYLQTQCGEICFRVLSKEFRTFVIDEVHCVKKVGFYHVAMCGLSQFLIAGEYLSERRLANYRSIMFCTVRVMALTATTTKSSRQEIIKMLRMVHPVVI